MSAERLRVAIGGVEVVEPATVDEIDYVFDHMRPEEFSEGEDLATTKESHRRSVLDARRSMTVKHNGVILAVACLTDVDGGDERYRVLAMSRTVHALEKGHRFTWLRAYGPLSDWLRESDVQFSDHGRLVALSPTDLPRALDVYRYAGARVHKTLNPEGHRSYWVIDLEKEV